MTKKTVIRILILAGFCIMGLIIWKKMCWDIETDWSVFSESSDYLANRERGFYNMRGIIVSDIYPVEDWVCESIENDQSPYSLELLQIHIGAYQEGPVSDTGLEQIRKVLEAYEKRNISLIIRVLYDWEGKGMESDPSDINIVLTHMEQIGKLIEEYKHEIYVVQGVFVGSWAEMHSSRYLSEASYLRLIQKMDEVIPKSVFLAVRTPAYWRIAAGTKEPVGKEEAFAKQTLASRLSLFNDGMLGNLLDCGTYGDLKKDEAVSLTQKWRREDELEFQDMLCRYVPNGGEAVLDNKLNDLLQADDNFRIMHVSYLNCAHDEEVMEKWEDSVFTEADSPYDGMNGFDYIERHLGYRFVIRNVRAVNKGLGGRTAEVSVEIENVGYGNRYTECTTEIILKNTDTGEKKVLYPDTDVRLWNSGEKTVIKSEMRLDRGVCYELYLKVTGAVDGTQIKFANEKIGEEEGYFLGTLRKGSSL